MMESNMYATPAATDYMTRLIAEAKLEPAFDAQTELTQLCFGRAALAGRDHVLPEDIKAMFPYVVGRQFATEIATAILDRVPILTK